MYYLVLPGINSTAAVVRTAVDGLVLRKLDIGSEGTTPRELGTHVSLHMNHVYTTLVSYVS